MTIVFDRKGSPKQQSPPPVEQQRQQPSSASASADNEDRFQPSVDERAPLLPPPPAYSGPASRDVERGPHDKRTSLWTRRNKLIAVGALVLLVLAFLIGLLIWPDDSQSGGDWSTDADWAHPTPTKGRSAIVVPLPDSSPHRWNPKDDSQRRPNDIPLYSRTTTTRLLVGPGDNKANAFFLHAEGPDATGSLSIVPDAGIKAGVVVVVVEVIYGSEKRLEEAVRIWEVSDKARAGVEILTAPRRQGWHWKPEDYLFFDVTIHVPASLTHYDEFEGHATNFGLHLGALRLSHSFDRFIWSSHNSVIKVDSLSAKNISLATTNAGFHVQGGIEADILTVDTTNGGMRFEAASRISVKDAARLRTTNGYIVGSEAADGFVVGRQLILKTSNDPIEGHFAAPEVHAETVNAHVSATFLGVSESISISTTNGRLTSVVHLVPSSSDPNPNLNPVPIKAHTTNAALTLTVPPAPFQTYSLAASTSSGELTLHCPFVVGGFDISSGTKSTVAFEQGGLPDDPGSRKIRYETKSKRVVKGEVVLLGEDDREKVKKGSFVRARTTNAGATLFV